MTDHMQKLRGWVSRSSKNEIQLLIIQYSMSVEHRITNARFWDQGKVGKSGTEESGNTPRRRTVKYVLWFRWPKSVKGVGGPGWRIRCISYGELICCLLPNYSLALLEEIFLLNDFPFAIRIPESIPPTIALDKGGACHATLDRLFQLISFVHDSWYQVWTQCDSMY